LVIQKIQEDTIKTKDVFEGTITNMQLESGILEGTGVYDKSCNPKAAGARLQGRKYNFDFGKADEMRLWKVRALQCRGKIYMPRWPGV